ncbi:hypothetical protein [Asanoa ferruginea]|nr:hypothetical protein [Asanoa ferruginea]
MEPQLAEPPRPGSSLALLGIPFAFSQDDLLTTEKFIAQAKDRGYDVSIDLLQRLHEHRLLLPLYRVSDTPVAGRRMRVEADDGGSIRSWVVLAAAEGRLRDPADEGYSVAWPYRRPSDAPPDRWWNGFVYSSWQLFDLEHVVDEYRAIAAGWRAGPHGPRTARDRRLTLALAALAPRYLPAVLGRFRFPSGIDEDRIRLAGADADPQELLSSAGFAATDLQGAADVLLLSAQSDDPMRRWVKLLRYASYAGWSKMRGEPLDCMWRRVAAELLLRAHEDLAGKGVLEPLPDLTGSTWHAPQHDRLTPQYPEAETLERALAELGLSPHPRVILLLEGKTEQRHVPRLMAELGLNQPQQVRIQACRSSKVNAHLIARYGITPRIGRRIGDRWLLDASPTALVVAMDPENHFATAAHRAEQRRNLQRAIREEVQYQDADISQEDLDTLVSVHAWGDHKYELANFTDDELVPAIAQLALSRGAGDTTSPAWEKSLREYLQDARRLHLDIDAPLGRIKAPKDKVALADILWPVLRAKSERELATNTVTTPVLKIALEVRRLIAKVSGVFALEVPAGFNADG